jgi:hypothetical protein
VRSRDEPCGSILGGTGSFPWAALYRRRAPAPTFEVLGKCTDRAGLDVAARAIPTGTTQEGLGLFPLAAHSKPQQGQVGRGADRTIHANVVHDYDPEPICVDVCDFQDGGHVSIQWLWPLYRQIKVCSHLPAC